VGLVACQAGEAINHWNKEFFNGHTNNQRVLELSGNMFACGLMYLWDAIYVFPLGPAEPSSRRCTACRACEDAGDDYVLSDEEEPEGRCARWPACREVWRFPHWRCDSHMCPCESHYTGKLKYEDVAQVQLADGLYRCAVCE
jgi:hypothetical protein